MAIDSDFEDSDDDSDTEMGDASLDDIDFDDNASGRSGFEELDFVLSEETTNKSTEPKQPYLNRLAMQAARRDWQRAETDSGSSEVQVAIFTERIIYLTKHLQSNPKDFHTRRGLIMLVNKRRTQLNYYFGKSPQKCLDLCSSLGIRFRPKSAVQSRETKYSSFKNTKSKIGMRKAAELQTRALQERSKVEAK